MSDKPYNPFSDPEAIEMQDGERLFLARLQEKCRKLGSKTVYIGTGLNVKTQIKRMQRCIEKAEHEIAVAKRMLVALNKSKFAKTKRRKDGRQKEKI